MKSIHWLITNVCAWGFTAPVAYKLDMGPILWAPAIVTMVLIIGLSLTSGITER
jgi:hypothetical protein